MGLLHSLGEAEMPSWEISLSIHQDFGRGGVETGVRGSGGGAAPVWLPEFSTGQCKLQNRCSTGVTPPLSMQTDDKIKKDKFVLSVAYSPDGKRIACGTASGRVSIFDCQSGTLLHSCEGHYKPVRSVTFTPGKAPFPHAPSCQLFTPPPAIRPA